MDIRDKYELGTEYAQEKDILVGELVHLTGYIYRYMGKQNGRFTYVGHDGEADVGKISTTLHYIRTYRATLK
jgi:hypothetical protein